MADPTTPHDEPRPPLLGLLIGLAGVLALAGLVIAIEPLRDAVGLALKGDTEALEEELRGVGGIALVLGVAIAHAIVFYPSEILDTAAGFVYGFWAGVALMMTGWVINAALAYWLGEHAARPLLHRLFGADRFRRFEGVVARGGTTLLLAMRLIPIVPFSLFSYAAGSARVPFGRFIWTTAVGYLPLTALFVYFGSRLDSLSATDPAIWVAVVLLLALLLLSRKLAPVLRGADRT